MRTGSFGVRKYALILLIIFPGLLMLSPPETVVAGKLTDPGVTGYGSIPVIDNGAPLRVKDIAAENELAEEKEIRRDKKIILYLGAFAVFQVLLLFGFMNWLNRKKRKAVNALNNKNRECELGCVRIRKHEQYKEQFFANMNHEIRTPLNVIIGMTDLLLDEMHSPRTEAHLKNIRQAGEHLVNIINDILDLSKAEAGRLELMEAPFCMTDFITQIRDFFHVKAREKELCLITLVKDDVPQWISADSMRIRQVLINLLGNAIKFTEKGSVTLAVSSEISDHDRYLLQFRIEDTGPGIPEEQQAMIFEEFVQSPEMQSSPYKGTGLGLAISRKLVERMGGELQLESQPGTGSVFYFKIPVTVSSEEVFRQSQADAFDKIEPRKGSFRILVVEDNPSNLIVTEGHLEKIFPESDVISVEDGQAALEVLEKEKVDLVLMDVHMPVLDGYATTRMIRQMKPEVSAIPVVGLTASVVRSDIQKCLDAGMNAYVPKPINRKVLARTVVGLLETERSSAEETSAYPLKSFLDNIPYRPRWTSVLNEYCNGKKDRFQRYLELYISETERETKTWDELIRQKENDRLSLSLHKLTAYIRIFTDASVFNRTVSLEEKLKESWDREFIPELLEIRDILMNTRRDVKNVLWDLKD